MSGQPQPPVCIIGAGSSGVAAAKALHERGVAIEGFEIGSDLGGMWRHENDNGLNGWRAMRSASTSSGTSVSAARSSASNPPATGRGGYQSEVGLFFDVHRLGMELLLHAVERALDAPTVSRDRLRGPLSKASRGGAQGRAARGSGRIGSPAPATRSPISGRHPSTV